MSSLHFKYFLAAVAGVSIIAIGTYSYFNKPQTPSLDLNKSAADSKPPRSFELSSDKATPATGKDAAKPANNAGAKPTAPPLGGSTGNKPTTPAATPIKPDAPKSETAAPAKRPTPADNPPSAGASKTGDSLAGPPGSIPLSSNAGAAPTSSAPPTPATPSGEVKLPPLTSSPPASPAGSTPESASKLSDSTRTTPEKVVVPEARTSGDAPKTSPLADGGRSSTPNAGGEVLNPSAGNAAKPAPAKPSGADPAKSGTSRAIRDTELDRGPNSGTPVKPSNSPNAPDVKRETGAPRERAGNNATGSGSSYTIASGDTLAKIASTTYGDERLWNEIKKANPGIDESRLKVGTKIVLPPKPETAAAKPTSGASDSAVTKGPNAKPPASTGADATLAARSANPDAAKTEKPAASTATHTVVRTDTLMRIARNVLKDEKRWREIYDLNRDKLKNPNAVEEGMVLKLPPAKSNDPARKPDAPKKVK